MPDKKLERSQICDLCRSGVVVIPTNTGEGVVHIRIVVNRDERIRVERRMNLRLCFRRAKLIKARDVQH